MRTIQVFSWVLSSVLTFSGAQQCPHDWVNFGNSCYAFLDDFVPWATAEMFCRTLHGGLLEIESQAENDFITAQINSRTGIQGAWLGLNDLLREGRWVDNLNGAEPVYTNWFSDQPDNSVQHENGEDCAWIRTDGRWYDVWCEDLYDTSYRPAAVCETDAIPDMIIE